MKVLIGLIGLINANLYDQKNIGIRAGNSEPWRHVGRQDKKNTEFGKRFEKVIFARKYTIEKLSYRVRHVKIKSHVVGSRTTFFDSI